MISDLERIRGVLDSASEELRKVTTLYAHAIAAPRIVAGDLMMPLPDRLSAAFATIIEACNK